MYKLYSILWCTGCTVYLGVQYTLQYTVSLTVYINVQAVQYTLVFKLCSIPWCTSCTVYLDVQAVPKLKCKESKLQLRILCVHIETSSLWAEFVNKNRSSVFVYNPRRIKALNFENFDNSHNSFLWPEYFIDFICKRWIPCQAETFVLCLHYRPETVHCSTKDAYTSKITFLAL